MALTEYRIIDFVTDDSMLQVSPNARHADRYPFTHASQDRFFQQFFRESFVFDGIVNLMYIHTAKENLPRPSYAQAWLFTQNIDELEAEWNTRGGPPDHIGEILFECGVIGEEAMKPRITVTNPDGTRWSNT
ncbi:MAG TPA: hypothetical protein VKB05_18170 [Pyrinomonadaceae bacterium]|nr:hypothetical protein [Pyrinomonadaceae bacterium]